MPKRKQYDDEPIRGHAVMDYRCAYPGCSETGTITESVIGPEQGHPDRRRWLCRWHYQTRHDPEGGRLALADIQARMPRREDWREDMMTARLLSTAKPTWTEEQLLQVEEDAAMLLSKMKPLPVAE